MLNLILALSSGALGGLITAGISEADRRLRKIIVLAFTLGAMFFSWRTALAVFAGKKPSLSGSLGGLDWQLAPDPLGAIFALIVSTLWLFATLYSFGYMEEKENQRTYYTFFLISLSATLGVALAGNLIALYLFYELLTLTTYPLVIHARTKEAMQAGKKYILYSLSGAGAILIAIVLTYERAGHLSFTGGPILANYQGGDLNGLLFLFIAGFGVKAAIMPLHRWLPAAMVAPTPISALLHAVAVVYSGVYGILRIVYSVFGHELMATIPFAKLLPWVAAFTILVSAILALRQDVLKRRLAYNTISELSYILLGAFTLQPWGLTGAIFHMISYSILKITLFFCAGIIAEQTGKVKVSQMTGVGWSLPKTMTVFGVVSLGMVGMLPLNTFWSKFYLMRGCVSADRWPLAVVLISSGIINAICFIPIVITSFRDDRDKHSYLEQGNEVGFMLTPTVFLASIAVLIGLWPGIVWSGVRVVVDWFF